MIYNNRNKNFLLKNKKLNPFLPLKNKRLNTIKRGPLKKKLNTTKLLGPIQKQTKQFLKLKLFRRAFIYHKKINFFKRLHTYFNEARLVWCQFLKCYLKKKQGPLIKYKSKVGHQRFFFFLQLLECRLSTLLIRSRFFFRLCNAYNAIKLGLILVNGSIITNVNYLICIRDLFQKRRSSLLERTFKDRIVRFERLRWRNYRWKKARFLFWRIRKASDFNMYHVRKENTFLNYLEINYKIPGGIILRRPFFSELILKREPKFLKPILLQKIYFVF